MPPRKQLQSETTPTVTRDQRATKAATSSHGSPPFKSTRPRSTKIYNEAAEGGVEQALKPTRTARARRRPLGELPNFSMGPLGPDVGEKSAEILNPKKSLKRMYEDGSDGVAGKHSLDSIHPRKAIKSSQGQSRPAVIKEHPGEAPKKRAKIEFHEVAETNVPGFPVNLEYAGKSSLYDRVLQHFPDGITPRPSPDDNPDSLAAWFTQYRLWTPSILIEFQATNITRLDLTSSQSGTTLSHDYTPLLTPLFSSPHHTWTHLHTLSLSKLPLGHSHIALLRCLPALQDLNISYTGIGTRALYHLVCHWRTLHALNIAGNPDVTDDACGPIAALDALKNLYLHETGFTMPGLRRLCLMQKETARANSLNMAFTSSSFSSSSSGQHPVQCRLVTIPSSCQNYLSSTQRSPPYCAVIPQNMGYIQNSKMVDNLQMELLKKNLALHAKYCKDIQVTGNKVELVARLKKILENRDGDVRVILALQPPPMAGDVTTSSGDAKEKDQLGT